MTHRTMRLEMPAGDVSGVFRPLSAAAHPIVREYQDWTYEIQCRQFGVTQRHVGYCAIVRPFGAAAGHYLRAYRSLEQAENAAIDWIDEMHERRRSSQRRGTRATFPPRAAAVAFDTRFLAIFRRPFAGGAADA
jgi:hypothetical protein